MRKLLLAVITAGLIAAGSTAITPEKKLLKATGSTLHLKSGDMEGEWPIDPDKNPDEFLTPFATTIFRSDSDTITVEIPNEWDSYDFTILTVTGDSARMRVRRSSMNHFENPDPELLKISPSGKLTKEQAAFDIDALLWTLSQVHPDIFSVTRQEDLLRAFNKAKNSLPDSVTPMQLYRVAAPLVAMIGDGHTNLDFPYKSVFTKDLLRMPVFVDVMTDRSMLCASSLDSVIGRGDRILSINGISADSLINSMLPFVGAEREHFALIEVDAMFTALYTMLYPAESYTVEYQPIGSNKTLTHTFQATCWDEITKRCPSTRSRKRHADYSYEIDRDNNVAVLDFRSCNNVEGMKHFADSMFRELKEKNIGNLIIDVRHNGGGNSGVGDVLLRYIAREPFSQMEKTLIRISPVTSRLMGEPTLRPNYYFFEPDSTDYDRPLTPEEGHYDGTVYLLTSASTFSSASSFAWTFKESGAGMVIGEETGGMNVAYGDILRFTLSVSGLEGTVSYKRFWQFHADENDIHGTLPDVAVPSADALDEAMKMVRNSNRKQKR